MPPKQPRNGDLSSAKAVSTPVPRDGPTQLPKAVVSKDLLQRLNFMYQASAFLEELSKDPRAHHPAEQHQRKRKRSEHGQQGAEDVNGLRSVVQEVGGPGYRDIARHSLLKLDPALKRSMCKSCNTVGVPGLTNRVRVKKSSSHFNTVTTTCLTCSKSTRIPAPPLKLPPRPEPLNPNPASSSAPTPSTENLDGPRRAARRRKAAGNPAFWQREARPRSSGILEDAETPMVDVSEPRGIPAATQPRTHRRHTGGHSIWVQGQVGERWGVGVQ